MSDNAIPRQEIEAAFKKIKKLIDGNIIKIYDDGAIRLIDDYGIIREFEFYEEFLEFARQVEAEA